jgi:carbon monoxide dehydrogenase subunit G
LTVRIGALSGLASKLFVAGWIVVLGMSLSASAASGVSNAADLDIQSSQLKPCEKGLTHDCIKVDVKLRVDAPVDVVWQVITDYANSASFISNLKSSSQTITGPNSLVVTQVGRVGWHYLNVDIKTIYQVSLNPAEKKIQSFSIGGDLKKVNMFTQLKATPNGGRMLEYTLITDPGPWAPLPLTEELLKRQALQSFTDLNREILKRAHSNSPTGPKI